MANHIYEDLVHAKEGASCEPCLADGSFKQANYFCKDCKEFYCQQCKRQHDRFKLLALHTAITVEKKGHYENVQGDSRNEKFRVEIVETTVSRRCNLNGEYTILVKPNEICLLHDQKMEQLYSWPIDCIRRYGVVDELFRFDAGRRSSTGEGSFCFRSTDKSILQDLKTAFDNACHSFSKRK